jgi:acetyl-CoA synthetase
LPKTISGKIRRVELRRREEDLHGEEAKTGGAEFTEEDFPDLKRG